MKGRNTFKKEGPLRLAIGSGATACSNETLQSEETRVVTTDSHVTSREWMIIKSLGDMFKLNRVVRSHCS